MATSNVTVVVPKTLAAGAKSRPRPSSQAQRGDAVTQNLDYALTNNTVRNYKTATQIIGLIRHLSHAEGQFSTAIHNMVEVAYSNYKIFGYDVNTQQFSSEATLAAMNLVSTFDTPLDYTQGTSKKAFETVIRMMLREVILTGGLSAETVLNKQRLMEELQVVGIETLEWEEDGKGGVYPIQRIAGRNEPVRLNIPTFFWQHLMPDPDTINPRSMVESAVKIMLYFEELMEDIRKAVRISGHNRLTVELDAEKIAETAPEEVKNDPALLQEYLGSVRDATQSVLEGLDPEDALVTFNSAKPTVLQSGTGSKIDYTPLLNVVAGQYATALKSSPAVLGLRLEGGSQQLGGIEMVMFAKAAKAVQLPVSVIMSRILTLGVRLMGVDATIWFRMDPIDLRPENEVAAFKVMQTTQILDLLSLGMISDDEAAVELGTFPRPAGAPNLSGTMFRHQGNQVVTNPGDTALGRSLQPDKDAPRKAGGESQ